MLRSSTAIELSDEQIVLLGNAGDHPIRVHNSQSHETCILVREDSYARLKSLLDLGEYDPDEGAQYINEIMADDDANDPLLESYQKYARLP